MSSRMPRVQAQHIYVMPPKTFSPTRFVPAIHLKHRWRLLTLLVVFALTWLPSLQLTFANITPEIIERADSFSLGEETDLRAYAQNQSPSTTPPSPLQAPSSSAQDAAGAGQKVKLYYLREATKIAAVLNSIAAKQGSELAGLVIATVTEDEIIMYGPSDKRAQARRIIATLDLPRPGISMEMWGIQISSRKPERMAEVMPLVRGEIDRTQQAVRDTYRQLQRLAREAIPDDQLDTDFYKVLVEDLGYESALDADRPLSLSDILLRMIAAKEPGAATERVAQGLDSWLRRSDYADYVGALSGAADDARRADGSRTRPPFERFFRLRGLEYAGGRWANSEGEVEASVRQGQTALLDFALHYGRLIHQPERFSSYSLQQAAEVLNTRLQAATDALNLDMRDLFVAPTIARIRRTVGRFKDVEYAQVGTTSVASLSGVPTEITSRSVGAFDVTPPLRLSELLTKADSLSKSAATFVPKPADNLVGAMPLSQVIGLIGALGEERSVWRELQAGVSVTLTPNVLRNMTSAELQINLKTGDPQAGSQQQGVRPLTRVSQHDVKTSIYVNALDFFDLSAFASQSTLNGGRGYVPIIGPIWRGLFGEIPVVGSLFSWKKGPQTVFSESLVLTSSFITPTAMGVAILFPTELAGERKYDDATFKLQWDAVLRYKVLLHRRR